jgi:glutamate synthase domain-containing protein 3
MNGGLKMLATISTEPSTTTLDCGDLTTRAINQAVRAAIAAGATRIQLLNPSANHNLGVALPAGIELIIEGSAGYYVGGLNDGATITVRGSAGWGAGESMLDGTIVVDGNAGNAVAASIRAGTVVVRGNASTRAGIAMKGGLLIVGGTVGPMAGFMMQKGVLVVCGDAGDGIADSMYSGTVFLGGKNGELGADAVFEEVTPADREFVGAALERWEVPAPSAGFRKLVAGRRLWNFQQSERNLWKSAL